MHADDSTIYIHLPSINKEFIIIIIIIIIIIDVLVFSVKESLKILKG